MLEAVIAFERPDWERPLTIEPIESRDWFASLFGTKGDGAALSGSVALRWLPRQFWTTN